MADDGNIANAMLVSQQDVLKMLYQIEQMYKKKNEETPIFQPEKVAENKEDKEKEKDEHLDKNDKASKIRQIFKGNKKGVAFARDCNSKKRKKFECIKETRITKNFQKLKKGNIKPKDINNGQLKNRYREYLKTQTEGVKYF